MKKLTLLTIGALLTLNLLAQAPQGISHQAVIRDAANQPVTETTIGIQVSILQGSAQGTVVYSETHTPVSNANGLISFLIGQGTVVSGVFSAINWPVGPYFIKTEADPQGGTNYTIEGISQLLSVPYALFSDYSMKAETLKNGENPGDMLFWNGQEWVAVEPGQHNQTLRLCNGVPTWGLCSYNLTLLANPEYGGTVSGTGIVREGDPVNISATPNQSWEFINWTKDGVEISTLASFEYIMPGNHTVLTAHFQYQPKPCSGMPTITDSRDGQSYATVQIGNQCWLKENLKYLPAVAGPGTASQTDPYYYVYGYDGTDVSAAKLTANYQTYGALYNGPAALTACPTGWHLPSSNEWTDLTTFVSSQPVFYCNSNNTFIAKSLAATTLWQTQTFTCAVGNNLSANNTTGFTGIPGGSRGSTGGGSFSSLLFSSNYYSSTALTTPFGQPGLWYHYMNSSSAEVQSGVMAKDNGLSVRCVRDQTTYQLNLIINPVGTGTVNGAGQYYAGQQADITAVANSGWLFVNWTDNGTIISTEASFDYIMPAENVTLQANFEEAPCGTFTVTDIDGNVYNTLLIGDQCWMDKNLSTTRFRDGSTIAQAWVYPHASVPGIDSDEQMVAAYGRLYSWHAANDAKGICPEGWAIPAQSEFQQLVDYVIATYEEVTAANSAYAFKSCRQVNSPLGGDCNTTAHPRWDQTTNHGFDIVDFSALPAGRIISGAFSGIGSQLYFWSSTEHNAANGVFARIMNGFDVVTITNMDKNRGVSLRCMKK